MTFVGFISVVTVLVALSGWFKVLYDHWVAKPKISGRLLYVFTGPISSPGKETKESFVLYPYLVNSGKSGVHVLDYELHVKFDCIGWKRVSRMYGKFNGLKINFNDEEGRHTINILDENLIYQSAEIMECGIPLHGWAPFAGNIDLQGRKILEYKLVCIDAYGKRHNIKAKNGEWFNPWLLQEMTNIKLPSA